MEILILNSLCDTCIFTTNCSFLFSAVKLITMPQLNSYFSSPVIHLSPLVSNSRFPLQVAVNPLTRISRFVIRQICSHDPICLQTLHFYSSHLLQSRSFASISANSRRKIKYKIYYESRSAKSNCNKSMLSRGEVYIN